MFYKKLILTGMWCSSFFCSAYGNEKTPDSGGWVSMLNGKDLAGWKCSEENPDSFKIVEGALVVHGQRAHLFFVGADNAANFTNFEFEATFKTMEKANSGIFFATKWQASGWPAHGYEAQVNCSNGDPRKTGSIYSVKDVMNDAPHKDNEWTKYAILVKGKTVTIKIDGKVVNEFTEPEDPGHKTRKLGPGTIAIQAHDPASIVHYKEMRYRVLP